MDAEERLYSVIKNLCGGRVYPEKYNQGAAYPGVVYSRTGNEPYNTMCGTIVGNKVFFRIEILAESLAEAKTIGESLIEACVGECVIGNVYNDPDPEMEITTRVIELSAWDD